MNTKEQTMRDAYKLNEDFAKQGIPGSLRAQLVGTLLLYLKSKHLNNEILYTWHLMTPEEIIKDIQKCVLRMIPEDQKGTIAEDLIINNIINDGTIQKLTTEEWNHLLTWTTDKLFIPIVSEELLAGYSTALRGILS